MPSSDLLSEAWAVRNRSCQGLYWGILERLRGILPEEQFEVLLSNLDVLGLKAEEEIAEEEK